MKLRIIQLGKNKDQWLSQAITEYQKRLSPFCQLEILELPDYSLKKAGTSGIVMMQEAKLILAKLNEHDCVIALSEEGQAQSSLDFSEFLTNLSVNEKRIVFVIGGVYGLDASIKKRAQYSLSLSKMTLTHRMARLVLVEQLYRAVMIAQGRKYHI